MLQSKGARGPTLKQALLSTRKRFAVFHSDWNVPLRLDQALLTSALYRRIQRSWLSRVYVADALRWNVIKLASHSMGNNTQCCIFLYQETVNSSLNLVVLLIFFTELISVLGYI